MTNLQIKEQIDSNNSIIQKIMTPNLFTLNNTILDLLKENEKLQEQCKHNYVEGYCEYCYKEETKWK